MDESRRHSSEPSPTDQTGESVEIKADASIRYIAMTNFTGQITNQCVIDAVAAKFKQARPYSEHWNYYMSPEQRKDAFSDSCAVFIKTCEERRKSLLRLTRMAWKIKGSIS